MKQGMMMMRISYVGVCNQVLVPNVQEQPLQTLYVSKEPKHFEYTHTNVALKYTFEHLTS